MSATESDVITVETDGVIVEKRYEPDEFPVPAIAFTLRSERDGPTEVRFVDVLPDGVRPEDVGFHPDFGEEFWSVDDGRIAFEREFEGGGEFTTVYAVRDSDVETIERFLVEPEIDGVEPVDPVGQDNSQVVRDVLAGDSSTIPGLGEEDDDEDDEEIEPLDLSDPGSTDQAAASTPPETEGGDEAEDETPSGGVRLDAGVPSVGDDADGGESSADGSAAGGPPTEPSTDPRPTPVVGDDAESVAAALASELREGTVDEESKTVLREELGVADGPARSGSVDARIQHLQTQVSDLEAYTDALEEFLDENGTARQLLEDLRADLDDVADRVDELARTTEVTASTVESVETDVEDVTATVESVETRVSDTEERLTALDDDLSTAQGSLSALEERVDGLSTSAVTADDLEPLEARLDDLDDDLAAVEEFSDRLETVESDLEGRLSTIEGDIDEIRDDIEAFREFRKSVSNVFGQIGAPDEDGDDEA